MLVTELSTIYRNPFNARGNWYRGNVHTHSTESDGCLAPEMVREWHAANGYQFVAITDHDSVTAIRDQDAPGSPGSEEQVLLPGAELSLGSTRQGSPIHCLAIGISSPRMPREGFPSPGAGLEWIWRQGGFAVIAHPYRSGFSTDELAGLGSIGAVEIFNYGSMLDNHKGDSTVYWDDLLARGLRVWGIASDDSHWKQPGHGGGGWLMVKSTGLTRDSIMSSLRDGLFYSTCQPVIEDIQFDGDHIWVQSSPAASMYWIGPGCLGSGAHAPSWYYLTEAEFKLEGDPAWVRVEVVDARGRRAWSNPIFFDYC